MRLLELCNEKWTLPDIQEQFDAVRAALSADMTQPFELIPSAAPLAKSEMSGTASNSHHTHSKNRYGLGNSLDGADYASHLMQTSDLSVTIPATPPSTTLEMVPSDMNIDTTVGYLNDEMANWDPTRLVT